MLTPGSELLGITYISCAFSALYNTIPVEVRGWGRYVTKHSFHPVGLLTDILWVPTICLLSHLINSCHSHLYLHRCLMFLLLEGRLFFSSYILLIFLKYTQKLPGQFLVGSLWSFSDWSSHWEKVFWTLTVSVLGGARASRRTSNLCWHRFCD